MFFLLRIRFEVRENAESWRSSSSISTSSKRSTGSEELSKSSGARSKFDEKYFEVDHPFIFFLWDYIASTIIVMGRVADPRIMQSTGEWKLWKFFRETFWVRIIYNEQNFIFVFFFSKKVIKFELFRIISLLWDKIFSSFCFYWATTLWPPIMVLLLI